MNLTVLGSDGTWPRAGGACSGFLVSSGATDLWLDAGSGTFGRLQQHRDVGDLDAIVISHGHSDHFVDVLPAFYARHYGGLGGPGLPFFSPEGFTDLLSLLVSEDGRNVMAEAYAFTGVHDRQIVEVGPFRITAYEMTHVGVRSMGYRIEADGAVLAYTGDTGPCEAVDEIARGADLFLCEATYQNDSELRFFHLSAEQAAGHAESAGCGRLVLTHVPPTLDPERSREEAAVLFHGPVELAREGAAWEVGA